MGLELVSLTLLKTLSSRNIKMYVVPILELPFILLQKLHATCLVKDPHRLFPWNATNAMIIWHVLCFNFFVISWKWQKFSHHLRIALLLNQNSRNRAWKAHLMCACRQCPISTTSDGGMVTRKSYLETSLLLAHKF